MVDKQSARLLVVEDEKNVGSTLTERLRKEGYDVTWSMTIEEARLEISQRKFDLAILDVGLPDGSGFQIGELLRKSQKATAILFLTAYGTPEDRIRGLELGAEDYVVKPFHYKELLLRIQNALKRARYLGSSSAPEEIPIGRAKVYFSRFEAEVDGQTDSLTHKECALLKLLYDRRGHVVSRDEILNEVWSEDEFPSSRTVDNFVMKLRRLVEPNPDDPRFIRSIRGVGYQLSLPEETEGKKK